MAELVGRRPQLDRIDRALAEVAGGSFRAIAIRGESGAGKTHLLDELARRALEHDLVVYRGRSTEFEQGVPFGLFTGAFARLAEEHPSATELAAAAAGRVAELDRYRLFLGLRRLLESQERGAVLVLDDLHWADPASVELTEFLLRRPPRAALLIAVAYQAQAPPGLADALARPDSSLIKLEPLPEAVAELVRLDAALTDLDPVPRLVAQAAAIAGDPADPELVAWVAELPDDVVAAAFDTLGQAGLVVREGPHVRFRHPVLRAAAHGMGPPAWRVHAHGRIADHLRSRRGPLLVLAHHTERSARAGDEVAVATLTEAAVAARHAAPVISARLVRRALELLPDRAELRDRRDELRMLLASTLGLSAESRQLLGELIQTNSRHRADAVLLSVEILRLHGQLDEATALLTGELDRLPDKGEPAGRALLELAGIDLLRHDSARVRLHAARAVDAVAGTGNTALEAVAHAVLALGFLQANEIAAVGTHIDRAAWLVDTTADALLLTELATIAPLAWVELHLCHHDRATRHVGRGLELANASGFPHSVPYLLIVDACLRTRLGQLPEALASAEEAGEYSRILGARETAAMADIVRLRPTLWRHGQQAAHQLANQIARTGRPSAGWWSGLARLSLAEVYLAAGNIEACLTELAAKEGDEATASYRWALRAVASALLGRYAQSRSDAREALGHAERSGLAHQLGVAHDARARVLSSAGDLDAALTAADTAVTHFVAAESPVEEGNARHLRAVLYARTGLRDAMREELGRAKTLYTNSSALWLATVLARDERRFAVRAPRERFSTGNALAALTAREREVVDLVTTGLTNREIAERLVLSKKTVETHLSRAFAKLHVRSRVDLTRRVNGETE